MQTTLYGWKTANTSRSSRKGKRKERSNNYLLIGYIVICKRDSSKCVSQMWENVTLKFEDTSEERKIPSIS